MQNSITASALARPGPGLAQRQSQAMPQLWRLAVEPPRIAHGGLDKMPRLVPPQCPMTKSLSTFIPWGMAPG